MGFNSGFKGLIMNTVPVFLASRCWPTEEPVKLRTQREANTYLYPPSFKKGNNFFDVTSISKISPNTGILMQSLFSLLYGASKDIRDSGSNHGTNNHGERSVVHFLIFFLIEI